MAGISSDRQTGPSSPQSSRPPGETSREAAGGRGVAGVIKDGVVAGIIGTFVVAAWFLLFDIARGKPFFRPLPVGERALPPQER